MSDLFDPQFVRARFPALAREQDGRPVVYFDGPAGSQVPRPVIEAMEAYLVHHNANHGGAFATSVESDGMLESAHRAVADFVGADDPGCVAFGPNMTTLTVALARSLGGQWDPADEVLVTRLEHDANFTPWVEAARESGATVRFAGIRADDCTLDLDDLEAKLSPATRLVAVGAASNAVGTINPLRRIADAAHAVGARVFVDAVHYAPHRAIDVQAWDCDFLVCSAYKFFGPHIGMLWGRRDLMESLPVHKLRTVPDRTPDRWMTGTQNHEGIAGALAAIDYLAGLGDRGDGSRRAALLSGFERIRSHESDLASRMLEALGRLDSIRIWGITDPARMDERVPTFGVTHTSRTPQEVARYLAGKGIFVWDGNFYALPLTETLGLEPEGLVRIGLLHYNTAEEIDRLFEALSAID